MMYPLRGRASVAVSSSPPNPTVELDRSNCLAAKLDPQIASPAPSHHRLGPVLTLRCDHGHGDLSFDVHRYWHMQFCSSACMTEYHADDGADSCSTSRMTCKCRNA